MKPSIVHILAVCLLFISFIQRDSNPFDPSDQPYLENPARSTSEGIALQDFDMPSFVFPLENYWYTSSNFGLRIIKGGIFGGERANIHKGIDLVAPEGSKIRAAADGTVCIYYPAPDGYFKGHPEYGGFIVLDHGHGIYTFYAHMSKTWVNGGQKIKQGDWIGVIGDTGYAEGIHLHFEIVLDPDFLINFGPTLFEY